MTTQTKYRIAASLTGISGALLLINILQHYVPGFHVLDIGNGLFFVACAGVFVAGPVAYYFRSQLHRERGRSTDQIAVETLAQIARTQQAKTSTSAKTDRPNSDRRQVAGSNSRP